MNMRICSITMVELRVVVTRLHII
ncbi:hypothetical protein LINPERPRIM_LOCUS39789 [Linum perenne]